MALINIPTSGVWSSIASALNSNFSGIDGRTGWAQYSDTLHTLASPLVIAAGVTTPLTNNAGSTIKSQLPAGVTDLYDGTRLISDDLGAAYMVRIGFTVSNSSQTGAFSLSADISAAGDGSITIFDRVSSLARGANTPQAYNTTNLTYSLGTFLANGALLRFESITGTSSIYDITYVISKIHKGR
jgi:hypothetical protein